MGNRLFVGNLPFDISEGDVRGFIEGEGRTVQSVKIVMDKDTGRPRGFAFVDVGNDQEALSGMAPLLSGRCDASEILVLGADTSHIGAENRTNDERG